MHLQQFQELKFQKIYADFSPDPLGFTQPSWSPQKTLPSYGTEITPRKWRFIGHILWKDSTSVSRTGLFERPKVSAKELDRDAPGLHGDGVEHQRRSWKIWGCPLGGGVLRSGLAWYVPLASQHPHPIIVNSVVNYRAHLSHFWANVIVISRTEFNASRLLNIKTTTGTIFQP